MLKAQCFVMQNLGCRRSKLLYSALFVPLTEWGRSETGGGSPSVGLQCQPEWIITISVCKQEALQGENAAWLQGNLWNSSAPLSAEGKLHLQPGNASDRTADNSDKQRRRQNTSAQRAEWGCQQISRGWSMQTFHFPCSRELSSIGQ